jgi:hypothetical protein
MSSGQSKSAASRLRHGLSRRTENLLMTGARMTTLHLEHSVRNFDAWKESFELDFDGSSAAAAGG